MRPTRAGWFFLVCGAFGVAAGTWISLVDGDVQVGAFVIAGILLFLGITVGTSRRPRIHSPSWTYPFGHALTGVTMREDAEWEEIRLRGEAKRRRLVERGEDERRAPPRT